MKKLSVIIYSICFISLFADDSYISHIYMVPCDKEYIPRNCNYPNITLESMKSLEDFDRCAPAVLSIKVRNLYWAAAGRQHTYERNFESLKKILIIPRVLRNVSNHTLGTILLNAPIYTPIGISPTSRHEFAHPVGESGSARAAAYHGTVFILSGTAQQTLEDVANAAFSVDQNAVLWAQLYISLNRTAVLTYMEKSWNYGYKAIVVTVDSPYDSNVSCNAKSIQRNISNSNLSNDRNPTKEVDPTVTFRDLRWIVKNAGLPVVAKGILRVEDAIKAAEIGVSAILVSNQGGRQMDDAISTVEALVDIVKVMKPKYPEVEIYIDGGIRSGYDVLKILAIGAKAAFIGRPAIWGLAIGGELGVLKVLKLLRDEFEQAMTIAGYNHPAEIDRKAVRLPTENLGWN